MIGDILAVYNFLKEEVDDAVVLSALFSDEGKRIEGDEKINVRILPVSEDKWFYEIEPIDGYELIPFPVNPAVHVDYGTAKDSKNPSTKFFRYVSTPLSMYGGGEANVKVNFLVFGYKPSDLINKRKKQ